MQNSRNYKSKSFVQKIDDFLYRKKLLFDSLLEKEVKPIFLDELDIEMSKLHFLAILDYQKSNSRIKIHHINRCHLSP